MNKLDEFINNYFSEIKKINDFHWNIIKENKFETPKIDYFNVYKFIVTATNFLIDLEPHLLDGLGSKLYNDINSLYAFYQNFYKRTYYNHLVFYGEFLESLQEYKNLKKEYEELKEKISIYNNNIKIYEEKLENLKENSSKYKEIKKKYVDCVYEYSKYRDKFKEIKEKLEEIEKTHKLEFLDKFEKEKKLHLLKLKKIISIKLYYYEALLWFLAKNSKDIVDFFENANIIGDFSTKTFIKYFLNNIDINKANNNEWLNYLNNLLKVYE